MGLFLDEGETVVDFLDKLKALSEQSDAVERPHSTERSSVVSQKPQNTNMPFDSHSQPSLPDEIAQSNPVDVSQQEVGQQPSNLPKFHQKAPWFQLAFSRRFKCKKPIYQRWWIWALIGMGAAAGGTYVTVKQSLEYVRQDLPDPDAVFTFVREGTLTIKAADGSILQQMGPATREQVEFDNIPQRLIEAFIAAEDKNYYEHTGVDYQAIARAFRSNLSAGRIVEGGSTITQQLARLVFLDQAPTLDRKLREALLAQKIETELTKEEILERYLNLVYLGSGAYGVADAAWIFFSKSVNELTLSEMAMIAGLAPAPSAYSPLVDLDAAIARRNSTLERMVEAEFITVEEKDRIIAEPLEINPSLPRNFYSTSPYFTSYIEDQLPNYLSSEQLERGGLTIETTLNPEWQTLAETTVQSILDDYSQWQGFSQGAMVTIDPRTGHILTMVGGTDFEESQFNRVTQAARQPGSTFKTFVYSAAIAAGFSPYQTYVDSPFVVDGYEPQNYGRSFRGTVSIRDALVSSINVVAVKAILDVGFEPVINLAQAMGIKSELYPYYSLALGASEVNLLELTSAYGTLANQGNYVEAHGIIRILDDRTDEVVYESQLEPQRALDADSTAVMTWMLEGVVQNGTGRNARLGRPVAGKTGTSEERRDLWFIGYIPQLVTGVWLGNDDSKPTAGASSTAAQAWHNFMAQIVEGIPVEEFPELPDLNNREQTIEAQPVDPDDVTVARPPEPQRSYQPDPNPSTRAPAEEPSEPAPQTRRSTNDTDEPESGGDEAPASRDGDTGSDSEPSGRDGSESGGDDGGDSPGSAPIEDAPPAPVPEPIPIPAPAPAPPPPPLPPVQPIQPSADPVPLSPPPAPAGTGND